MAISLKSMTVIKENWFAIKVHLMARRLIWARPLRTAEQAQMRRLAIKRTFLADQFFLITVIDFKDEPFLSEQKVY